jgi:hypothetical protein
MAQKKSSAKKKPSRAAGKKRSPAKKAAAKAKAVKKKPARSKAKSLGRPKLPADAKLDHVFQKDYQAREVFEFLRIESIRELEQFGPDEIIRKLAGPVVQTVDRIRKALALNNRCLAGDQQFAQEFQRSMPAAR